MVKFELIGFDSFQEYFDVFFDCLKSTNHTFSYFVDWNKIQRKAEKYEDEIMLLQVLSKKKKDERKQKLHNLIKKHPKITKVIPLIIAVRDYNMKIMDERTLEITSYSFNGPDKSNIMEIVDFCDKTGIIDLFDQIDSLYDYIFGLEVGLDSNARKNRSGKIFEEIIENVLEQELEKAGNYSYKKQTKIKKIDSDKKFDFIIKENGEPIVALETNFYSSTGSKPIEIARSYTDLHKNLKKQNLTLIWITDGDAWKKMKNPLKNSMKELDYILNLELLQNNLINILQKDPEIQTKQQSF
ncbi:DpnII family type II restriction endonuclease [Methanonatronarchaeum sp. AMET-Sl]|uniref:DpnII family type II restriction endonuclease n=1 Tax=Methanonatronarchaeum sp. AMET-Sl TaxID=3037654 RepID=UPI00244E10E0|nr:DpnII family type II restriction endonuclease [Methanonatronarchaeum sp. AMET-Sl]WGI17946.1 DpnII family type II restriction endonuclease [Methanonatronarchaeum sp. AMET-Sl]